MIKNLFIKGSIFYIIGAIFSLFFSYLFRIILASNLSLEEYGLFYSMLNFILFFLVFRNLGFNQGVVKFGSDFLSKKNFNALRSLLCFVISSQFIISTIFVFIFIFISDFLAQNYFNLLYSSFLFKVFSIYFVTSLLSLLLRPIFRIFYMSKQINTFEPLKNLLIVILFLIFNYFFDSLISAILALVVTPIFVFLIFIPSLSKLISKFTNVGANDYTIIPNFLFFSFPLILSDLGGRFINYFDTFMLTSMKSLIDVGIYNVLLPSASVLLLLASPIILFIVPYLRKNIKNNFLKANIFYKKIINGFLL
ncbi:oligosaccharide flippase family protein, partial [Candidatus Woesearchaeota archaeon]|nr:oligosaccharide flippase family protein [Candidatus Woesearchaeota archaeon]